MMIINENVKAEYALESHQRQRLRSYQQLLEDFQCDLVYYGLLSSSKESQSQGQMMIKKAVGMDDDAFENDFELGHYNSDLAFIN